MVLASWRLADGIFETVSSVNTNIERELEYEEIRWNVGNGKSIGIG